MKSRTMDYNINDYTYEPVMVRPYHDLVDGDVCDNRFVYTTHGVKTIDSNSIDSPIRDIQILSVSAAKSMYQRGIDYGIVPQAIDGTQTALISIGWSTKRHPAPEFTVGENGLVAIKRLEFGDVCDNVLARHREAIITRKTAEEAADFIMNILPVCGAKRLAVHCDAGISRSSATAAAASSFLWGDDIWAFMRPTMFGPNITVYTRIMKALGLLRNDDDVRLAYAKHEFAEWAYRGDNWAKSSYNVDNTEIEKARNCQYASPIESLWTLEKNPLNGYKQNPIASLSIHDRRKQYAEREVELAVDELKAAENREPKKLRTLGSICTYAINAILAASDNGMIPYNQYALDKSLESVKRIDERSLVPSEIMNNYKLIEKSSMHYLLTSNKINDDDDDYNNILSSVQFLVSEASEYVTNKE